jgi:alpha-glucosidase
MLLQRIIYILQAIGLHGIIRTIQYGIYRDRIEKHSNQRSSHKILDPGKFVEAQSIQGGIQLTFENAQGELLFLSENIIRVSWIPGKAPIPYTLNKTDWEFPNPTITHQFSSHRLSLGNYVVNIALNGEISIEEITGKLLRQDNPPVRKGNGWSLSTNLHPDEHIYGLGERAGNFNLRPGTYQCWNTDAGGSYSSGDDPLYIATPIYLSISSQGRYLVYFENSFPSEFSIKDTLQASFSGGMLRYYVILGSLNEIYTLLFELIGYPCMPPRWVFGYHQSRWGYKNEAEIRELVKNFDEHNLPLSAIHLDIDYMKRYRVFSINKSSFPSLKQLTADLDKKGIKLVASINPAVKRDKHYEIYSDGLAKDIFCKLPSGQPFTGVSWPGWSVFPDFTKYEARKWWQEQYGALLSQGIAGIWHDMNEPSSFAAWGDKTFPANIIHSMDGAGGDHLEAHNLYGLLMNQAGYDGINKYFPNKRPWQFSRAGWAGLQRYAWNWTGDIESTWKALKMTLPMILGLSLSGHCFSGADIGGFSGDPSAELYLRWFQLSCFLPLFRTHSAVGTKSREPWVFGEPTTNIIRKYLQLRYKLIPYIYTAAWDAVNNGIPIIRPIFWDEPSNEVLWDTNDSFLLGSCLLIAPIQEENARNRSVIFPEGKWFSFWDDQAYQGISIHEIRADLEMIPIFIKAGSILPMEENNELSLHIYPKVEGNSINQIYFDDGDGYGSWRLDRFHSTYYRNHAEVFWDISGEYQFPYSTINLHFHGNNPTEVRIDGKSYALHNKTLITPIFQNLKISYESVSS